jgi:pilus assembly protein CpaF
MTNSNLNNLVAAIREEVSYRIDLTKDPQDDDILDSISALVAEKSKERYLNLKEKQEVISSVFNSMRRLDILQPLLVDPTITEIMINSPEEIFIERHGRIEQLSMGFESSEKLENIIQSIVAKVNRVVNEASPIVDARLQDGSRVNVVLPPLALKGPTMTIRKFPEEPLTIVGLVQMGALSQEAADFLAKLVRSKFNIFVCGGTGSGKTTFLNALSDFIPSDERIITIEDSAELQIKNIKNLVRLETRNANTEGKGEISIRDLIKTSLRMRPNRIIVGEVRGAEAMDMLQAMNTGHDGSLSTGHANTTKDMLSRLETMVLSGASLPVEVIRKQISAALDIMIHLGRLRDGTRKVLEITEVLGFANGDIELRPLFQFTEEDEIENKVIGFLNKTEHSLVNTLKLQQAGISLKE